MRVVHSILLCALTLIPCLAVAQQPPGSRQATLWASPPNVDNGQPMRDLFEHPQAWIKARSHMAGLGYTSIAFAQFSDADLRVWFPQIRRWNLRLTMEVGAIKEWGPTGTTAFEKSRKTWDRFLADGAVLDSVSMDEPMRFACGVLKKSQGWAVEETATYVALLRKNYPTWKIGDIEPYPSYDEPTILAFIDALQVRLKQMGVRGLDFFRLDVDYTNFVPGNPKGRDGWLSVHQLETEVQRRGLPFSMIYWAAHLRQLREKGQATELTWEDMILRQGADYRAAGGRPDEYFIEDWVGSPRHSTPENQPGTFMHSVDAFDGRFVPQILRGSAVGEHNMRSH